MDNIVLAQWSPIFIADLNEIDDSYIPDGMLVAHWDSSMSIVVVVDRSFGNLVVVRNTELELILADREVIHVMQHGIVFAAVSVPDEGWRAKCLITKPS